MPSSSSSNAFARRVSRVSAFPSRTSAIRSARMLGSRKPPRIMPPTRIACRDNGKRFFAYLRNRGITMFDTTIAGSLPKPSWLAEPDKLWPQWRLNGADLAAGKLDATLLAVKLQEDAGIDVVTDGEQSRQHFVHGLLEFVDGIDFANKVEMGIRNDRYKAMVPTVTGALRLKGRVHGSEARFARAHTKRKLKFTLPGPMTIVDTIADAHYGDRVEMAMAFADLLNA